MSLKIGGFATLLQVFDMPAALAFFGDVVRFDVVSERPSDGRSDCVMLKRFGSQLTLNTAYEAPLDPRLRSRCESRCAQTPHYSFDCDDVQVGYVYLQARGFALNPPVVTDYDMKQLYPQDPDGYETCVHHPVRRPDTPELRDAAVRGSGARE